VFSRAGFWRINTLARIVQEGKEEDFSPNPQGLTLQRREEHGNTFAPEIEYSIGTGGIPLKGEEIR